LAFNFFKAGLHTFPILPAETPQNLTMKKLVACLVLFALITSCNKEEEPPPPPFYDEEFYISFKLDGTEYKTNLKPDSLNFWGHSAYHNGVYTTYTLGPGFTIDASKHISFNLGNYYHIANDTTGNLQRLKYLYRPGNKEYKCMNQCDTALTDAVQISLIDDPIGVNFWSTTKRKITGGVTVEVLVNQAGNFFTITEVKESTTNRINKNAIIVKGIFKCTLHEVNSENKRQLTDGAFTCIVPVL
jgi:hypothetical protein